MTSDAPVHHPSRRRLWRAPLLGAAAVCVVAAILAVFATTGGISPPRVVWIRDPMATMLRRLAARTAGPSGTSRVVQARVASACELSFEAISIDGERPRADLAWTCDAFHKLSRAPSSVDLLLTKVGFPPRGSRGYGTVFLDRDEHGWERRACDQESFPSEASVDRAAVGAWSPGGKKPWTLHLTADGTATRDDIPNETRRWGVLDDVLYLERFQSGTPPAPRVVVAAMRKWDALSFSDGTVYMRIR